MAQRPRHRHQIRRGKIESWPSDRPAPEQIASRVSYRGNTLHKNYPSVAGPAALRSDTTKCEKYEAAQWPQILDALRNGILAGVVSDFRGDFPSRVWVWINDVLHEARLDNETAGIYHGFPLTSADQYPEPLDKLEAAPRVRIPTA